MPTNKTIDCQCGHSITAHLTVCDDCSCYKFESKSKPTPNPQETVELCPYLEMRGHSLPHDWDSQWCKNCGRFRETLPNTQSPELAEPHVVQPPQESSPGFEEAARQILFRVHSSQPLGLDYKDAVKAILAAHQKEIQAAKREGKQTGYRHVANYMDATPSDTSDEVKRAWAEVREFLNKQLEEETTA